MSRPFQSTLALLAMLACVSRPAAGQSTYGAVVGAVTDPQNALVPAAQVKLTEVQTNVSRATLTNSVGTYEFPNINQGLYVIEVTHPGFAIYKTQEFQVPARQTVRIDAELRTATVQEALVVADSAPLVNTENPTVASAKSNRELQQLPFVFRVFNTSPVPAIGILPEVQKAAGNEFSLSSRRSRSARSTIRPSTPRSATSPRSPGAVRTPSTAPCSGTTTEPS